MFLRSLVVAGSLLSLIAALQLEAINDFDAEVSNHTTPKPAGISKSTKELLTKFHGIAFLFAWFFFVSIAFFCARYLRDLAPDFQPFGIRIWYHIHRTCNLIAAGLMIIGLVTILIAHEWNWLGPKIGGGSRNTSATAYHSICGLLSVIIAWLQPLNALLRCGPTDSRRPIFNWSHRILGALGWLLAAITIVLACNNFAKHFTDSQAALSITSAFLGFCGASLIVAEGFKIWAAHKTAVDSDSGFRNLKDVKNASKAHTYLIGLFGIIAFGVCTTVAVLIARKNY